MTLLKKIIVDTARRTTNLCQMTVNVIYAIICGLYFDFDCLGLDMTDLCLIVCRSFKWQLKF